MLRLAQEHWRYLKKLCHWQGLHNCCVQILQGLPVFSGWKLRKILLKQQNGLFLNQISEFVCINFTKTTRHLKKTKVSSLLNHFLSAFGDFAILSSNI